MKKLILSLILFTGLYANAQEVKDKNLKIFKFQPFSLITGCMNFNQEMFNKERTRSTVIGLGIRYVNKKNENSYYGTSVLNYTQLNKWQGVTASIERRLYVPGFFSGDKFSFINKKASFGVYFAPGIKAEFNQNKYDKGGYNQIIDNTKPNNYDFVFVKNEGKVNYLGVMPNMNIGMQFTLFQNLYIDTYIGGGIRFLSKKVIESKGDSNAPGYYSNGFSSGAIETFIIKEGVQPNFGFALGLNF